MAEIYCLAPSLAEYCAWTCQAANRPLTNLMLQRILYFLQIGFCVASRGGLLFPESFIASTYGPKIPEVYKRYSHFRGLPFYNISKVNLYVDSEILSFVNDGIIFLRKQSPWRLNELCQGIGSPCELTRHKFPDEDNPVIENKLLISKYGFIA